MISVIGKSPRGAGVGAMSPVDALAHLAEEIQAIDGKTPGDWLLRIEHVSPEERCIRFYAPRDSSDPVLTYLAAGGDWERELLVFASLVLGTEQIFKSDRSGAAMAYAMLSEPQDFIWIKLLSAVTARARGLLTREELSGKSLRQLAAYNVAFFTHNMSVPQAHAFVAEHA